MKKIYTITTRLEKRGGEFFLLLCLFFINAFTYAQLPQEFEDAQTRYRNERGAFISRDSAIVLLTKNNFSITRLLYPDGRALITLNPMDSSYWDRKGKDANDWVENMKGRLFPSFKLKRLNGELVTRDTLIGHYSWLVFWFIDCESCRLQVPKLNEIRRQLGNERLNYYAITFDNSNDVGNFLNEETFDFTILTGARDFTYDMGIRFYPTHLLLDEEGCVLDAWVGDTSSVLDQIQVKLHEYINQE